MLQRLSIGKRLAFAFGTLVAMSAGLLAVAAFGLHVADTSLDGITGKLIPANAITARAKAALLQSRAAHESMLASLGEPKDIEAAKAEWDSAQAAIDKAMADYAPFATNETLRGNLQIFRDGVLSYRKAVEPVAAGLKSGAISDLASARQQMKAADKGYEPAFQLLASIEEKVVANGSEVFAKVNKAMSTITLVLFGLCLAGGAAATLLAWRITRSVVDPVKTATAFAEQMASGDLSSAPRVQGHDEIARMLEALARMQQSLSSIVGEVRNSAESISVASSEVATGNGDLSARTEQMASNLQETAASMEQITGTVNQTADSARTAGQLAVSASDVAQRGGTVVEQVVATMQEITAASTRINDIIGVIDGIAFQTNILALNAAVEAARAGEQGRGFAVVAGEVRQLARRSAEAAREIKTLISTSVEKVENGSRLVQDAGATMVEIVASVRRVNDIVGEIGTATGEQSSGIGQINVAVTQLDQVTQQNAALVEESAAAAESLKDQASRLAQIVSQFRVAPATAL